MTTSNQTVLFLNNALILGKKGSFLTPADGLGGVGGLSLKKITIRNATIVPIIAWHSRELKMSYLALSSFPLSLSES